MAVKPDLGITALLDQVMTFFRENTDRIMELAELNEYDPAKYELDKSNKYAALIPVMAAYVLMGLGSEQSFFQIDTLADVERFYEKIDEAGQET